MRPVFGHSQLAVSDTSLVSAMASKWLTACCFVQALFRKIAAALPGMEALSSHKDDLVDVNLKPTSNPQAEGKAGGCAC